MRRLSAIVVSIIAWIAAGSAAACSETPPMPDLGSTASEPVPQDAVGLWRISIAGGTPSCLLALNLNNSQGEFGVVLEGCQLPGLSRARSWRMTHDGLELRDEQGAVLARLNRKTVDAYHTVGEGLAYRMERAPLT